MKGLFIPEITAEMFRNGCLEGIEALMAEGEIHDIDYTRWIPVSERLPKRGLGLHYLVTLKGGHEFRDDVYEAFYDNGGWHIGYHELADDDVIAWMPLPKPYREENEVEE